MLHLNQNAILAAIFIVFACALVWTGVIQRKAKSRWGKIAYALLSVWFVLLAVVALWRM
jgi:membrane protease YdiL (CAAX protease family)